MARHHPWSGSSVDDEVDIMPVSREQYTRRKPTVDAHFMRRRLVETRKQEWRQMLQSTDDSKTKKKTAAVPKHIDTGTSNRANAKNQVKRQVVEATASRLNEDSQAAIREMRSARLSAKHNASSFAHDKDRVGATDTKSVRQMRLARLKSSGSSSSLNNSLSKPSTPSKHKSLRKGARVYQRKSSQRASLEQATKEPEQVSSTIREMRLAQGKAPVAKSYTSSTSYLRVPKTTATSSSSSSSPMTPGRSRNNKRNPALPNRAKQGAAANGAASKREKEENDDDIHSGFGSGCTASFMKAASNFTASGDGNTGCTIGGFPDATKETTEETPSSSQDVGCGDLNQLLSSFGEFIGFGSHGRDKNDQAPLGGEETSRSSGSEESATMYIKKYGYDDL